MHYIYAIQHNATKKIYIGKTKNVYKRYKDHLNSLRLGKHGSIDMQYDYDKYGEDFSVYVLEEVDNGNRRCPSFNEGRSRASDAELKWMIKYDTIENGYNKQDYIAKKMMMADKKSHNNPFLIKDGFPKVGDCQCLE